MGLFLTHCVSPSVSLPSSPCLLSFICCVGTSSAFLNFHASIKSVLALESDSLHSSPGSALKTSVNLTSHLTLFSLSSLI